MALSGSALHGLSKVHLERSMNLIERPGSSVSPEHFSEALPNAK